MKNLFKIICMLALLMVTAALQASEDRKGAMRCVNEYSITIDGQPAAIAAVEYSPDGGYCDIYLLNSVGIIPGVITDYEWDDYVLIRNLKQTHKSAYRCKYQNRARDALLQGTAA
jgi:hypothetical protein